MADAGAVPAVDGAPQAPPAAPGLAPPVLPNLPFGNTPGSITDWIMAETAESTNQSIMDYCLNVEALYAALPDRAAQPVPFMNGMRALEASVLASTEFAGFLTISTLDGALPTVSLVSNFARYSAGLGASRALSGRIFGFMGETIEEQMPALVILPAGADMLTAGLVLEESPVPTREQLLAHYGVPSPSTLMPGLGAAGETQEIPRMVALPTPWVPYFMAPMSPMRAWETITELIATLNTDVMRDSAEYLSSWCAAACIRNGPGVNQRRLSQLDIPFESPTAPDRKITAWAKRRIAQFISADPLAAPVAPVAGLPDPAAWFAGMGANATGSATKQFSEIEHMKIRALTSLTELQYDTMRPPIYSMMLNEGRTMVKVDGILHQLLAPDPDADVPVHVFVSQDMVRDVKDLRFGWNGDLSFETCHRGISPFAVVSVSQESASRRKRAQERALRATHLTPSDIEGLETAPGVCPHGYDGLLRLLAAYLLFIVVLGGRSSNHYLEVIAIRRALCKQLAIYEKMTPADVAEIVWAIFMDARSFYSDGSVDPLPVSNLMMLRMYLNTGSIKKSLNCPVDRLLGVDRGPASLISGSAGSLSSGMSSLSGGSGLSSAGSAQSKVNGHHHADLKRATADLIRRHPDVRFIQVMDSLPSRLTYPEIKVGGAGSCLDMHYLGRCKNAGCHYKHGVVGAVAAVRAAAVLPRVKQAVAAYLAAQS